MDMNNGILRFHRLLVTASLDVHFLSVSLYVSVCRFIHLGLFPHRFYLLRLLWMSEFEPAESPRRACWRMQRKTTLRHDSVLQDINAVPWCQHAFYTGGKCFMGPIRLSQFRHNRAPRRGRTQGEGWATNGQKRIATCYIITGTGTNKTDEASVIMYFKSFILTLFHHPSL